MISGDQVVSLLSEMNATHVVWVPDSTLGQWEPAMRAAPNLHVITVCREGEAWGVAAGLYLGGARPVVMIQCTGLFESGDALRNVLHDYRLPLFAIIGYRSYLNQETLPGDTCLVFTEPVLKAWNLDFRFINSPEKVPQILELFHDAQQRQVPAVALFAEGRA